MSVQKVAIIPYDQYESMLPNNNNNSSKVKESPAKPVVGAASSPPRLPPLPPSTSPAALPPPPPPPEYKLPSNDPVKEKVKKRRKTLINQTQSGSGDIEPGEKKRLKVVSPSTFIKKFWLQ